MVSACAPSHDHPDRSSNAESLSLAAEAAWSLDLDIIGQPQVASGVALVHARAAEDRMHLVAVEVASGKELWRVFVAPGWGDSGRAWTPVLRETRGGKPVVAYVEPSPDELSGDFAAAWSTSVVVADATTGTELARSARQTLSSRPVTCSDGSDLCYTELLPHSDAAKTHRIELDKEPRLVEDTSNPVGESDHSLLEDGIYFRSDDLRGEYLGRTVEGKRLWEKHIERYFGEGYDTDYGYSWAHSTKQNLLVLSVQRSFDADPWLDSTYEEGDFVPRDLGARKQVAVDSRTGEIVWARVGRDSRCVDGWTSLDRDTDDGWPVRCSYQGTSAYDGEQVTYASLKITAEGFDPATGETQWSHVFPTVGAEGPIDDAVTVRGSVLLTEQDGQPALLDTNTGDVVPAEPDMVFACAEDTEFTYRQRRDDNHGPYVAPGGVVLSACDASGKSMDSALSLSAVEEVGITEGKFTLVGLAGRLVAFKTPLVQENDTSES